MTWTTERPTSPGWYWFRSRHPASLLQVVRVTGDGVVHMPWGGSEARRLTDPGLTGATWAGPITEPA